MIYGMWKGKKFFDKWTLIREEDDHQWNANTKFYVVVEHGYMDNIPQNCGSSIITATS